MYRKSGFTLIELLVVMAVIAVLMAILAPALGKAKESARAIRCQSNLKQYGLAMRMYLDNYNGNFPNGYNWLKTQSSGSNYLRKGEVPNGVLWPYIKALKIHLCPTFASAVKATAYADTAVSYSFNSYLTGTIWSNWLGAGATAVKRETEVYNPNKVVLFTEENPWTISGYSSYPFNDTHFTVGNKTRQIDNYATFHRVTGDLNKGGANAVLVDGHVEFLPRFEDFDQGFRLAWPKKQIP